MLALAFSFLKCQSRKWLDLHDCPCKQPVRTKSQQFQHPDGQDVLVYQARSYKDIVGDPLYDPNRHARAKIFGWNEQGLPVFGVPEKDSIPSW